MGAVEIPLYNEYLQLRCLSNCHSVAEHPFSFLQCGRDLLQFTQNSSVERVSATRRETFRKITPGEASIFVAKKISLMQTIDFILALLRALEKLDLALQVHALPLKTASAAAEDEAFINSVLHDVIRDSEPCSKLFKALTGTMLEPFSAPWQKFLLEHHLPFALDPTTPPHVDIRLETQRIVVRHHAAYCLTTDSDLELGFQWCVTLSLDPDLFVVTNAEIDVTPLPHVPSLAHSHSHSHSHAHSQIVTLFQQTIVPIVQSATLYFDKELAAKNIRKLLARLPRQRPPRAS
jgi:hypothetical protein